MRLVIVESPTKAKTLTKFLGPEYTVKASFGHITDLPKKELGVDTEHDFTPNYVTAPRAKKLVIELKAAAEKASEVYLATDPDREGEAIAWHVAQALQGSSAKRIAASPAVIPANAGSQAPDAGSRSGMTASTTSSTRNTKRSTLHATPFQRVVFHEITKGAVQAAFEHPRLLDMNLVDAQQARRILDRLVGYKLSPLLWKKIRYGLSAGRVQSVALRLIVERERERENFKPDEYWTIDAKLKKLSGKGETETFSARLMSCKEKKVVIGDVATASRIFEDLQSATYSVLRVTADKRKREPYPPFTTSTLQQAAVNLLGFSGKRTMSAAQSLYEQGLITYHRTDSFNLAETALTQLRETIKTKYGPTYLPPAPRLYKTKSRLAQEAHEAIRPTNPDRDLQLTTSQLSPDEAKIYHLVWRRSLACQMVPAVYNQTAAEINAGDYGLRARGSTLEFDGWLAVFGEEREKEESVLPVLSEAEALALIEVVKEQHFTEPSGRFTEATLIKELEENGIGRPSTYVPIMTTIIDRGYVVKEGRALKPEPLGKIVNDLLVKNFEEVVDIGFTARLEGQLDEVAAGTKKWVPLVGEFYFPFAKKITEKEATLKKEDFTIIRELPDKKCPECGRSMSERLGKYGTFLSCSGFPACKFAEPEEGDKGSLDTTQIEEKCPLDGGNLQLKEGKFGKFIACRNYPGCKFTKPYLEKIGLLCPDCGKGDVIVKRTRSKKIFFGCGRYPECKWASWKDPRQPQTPKTG
ncbi:MAG: type I DNA topoisomerase [Patescibacteria group bacterium]